MPNFNSIANLSAPGAASFENPWALSYKSLFDVVAVIIFSEMLNPTLYEGELLYWSNINVSVGTFIKYPLIKYIPSLIEAEDPVFVAPLSIHLAKVAFASILVLL